MEQLQPYHSVSCGCLLEEEVHSRYWMVKQMDEDRAGEKKEGDGWCLQWWIATVRCTRTFGCCYEVGRSTKITLEIPLLFRAIIRQYSAMTSFISGTSG